MMLTSRRSAVGRRTRHVLLALGLLAAVSACVYDADDRCGPNQVKVDHGRCACAANTVPAAEGCDFCPEHEVAESGSCVCESGFERAEESGPCVLETIGLGDACDDDSACMKAPYTHCQASPGGAYCTNLDCSGECEGGYACDTAASPPYCRRPPTGQGAACTSQDDCAGNEASYCEMLQGHICLVQGCVIDGSDCYVGWTCCDLSAFGFSTLCVPEGNCPTQ